MPIIFKGANLSQFPSFIPKDYCWEALKCSEPDHRHGLFLTGPRGTGKSHFAVAAMREILKRDGKQRREGTSSDYAHCTWVTAPDLLLEIRASFNRKDSGTEEDVVNRYSDWRHVLVLDDLGAEKTSEWAMSTLFTIINRRYENLAHTIITSNLSLKELSAQIGDRIASRIAGLCRVIEFKGKDRRLT